MNWIRRIALCLGIVLLPIGVASITARAAVPAALHAGDLDPTFGTAGTVTTDFGSFDEARATAIQGDGKIVAAGDTGGRGDNPADFALARYNPDGSLDASFGTGGKVTTDFAGGQDIANAVAVQPDGKIIAAGSVNVINAGDFALARYNADGSLDSSFGTGGTVTTDFARGQAAAKAVRVGPDGKIVAVGNTAGAGHVAVARYNTDGSLDSSFGAGGTVTTTVGVHNDALAMAIQPDDKIIAAGVVVGGGDPGPERFLLIRYDADGSLDPSFGTGGEVTTQVGTSDISTAVGVAIQHDGKIIAVGQAVGATEPFLGTGLARYNPDGSLDASFGTGGTVTATLGEEPAAMAVQTDGKIVTAGRPLDGDFAVSRFLGETAAPVTVQAGGPYTGPEGAQVNLSGTVSDPAATHTWSVVAKSGVDAGATCTVVDPAAVSTTVTCTDDGVYTITLTANDGSNPPVSDTSTVTVDNAAPAVTITAPADGTLIKSGTPVTITAHFTDPGANDTHTCSADVGNGAVVESTGTCTLTHAFPTGAHDVAVTVTDDDGGVGTATVHLVAAVSGEAFGLQATGPIQIPATPHVTCPPDDTKTTAVLNTPLASIHGLTASCHVDPATGTTMATASAGTITALGLIHITGIDSTCTSTATGLTGTSNVGTINGRPIGTGHGSVGIPGIAQVFFNETTTSSGHLAQNAIRIHTLLGEDIILAGCRLGQ